MKNLKLTFLIIAILSVIGELLPIKRDFTVTDKLSELSENPLIGRIDSKYLSDQLYTEDFYVIKLINYKSDFAIPVTDVKFDQYFFEKTVRNGDSVNLIVMKNFKDLEGERACVFEITKGKTTYFKKEDTLLAYKKNNLGFYIGGICFLLILIINYINKKKLERS